MAATRRTLEIAVQSLADAQAAAEGGADRLEVCSALEIHGLTPSHGLLRQVRGLGLPFVVMIRPRGGDFCYDAKELNQMCHDAEQAFASGAGGIVFGCLRADGSVDVESCGRLLDVTMGGPAVFHRAFDLTPNPAAALEQLVQLGVVRVLTSGGAASVRDPAARARIAGLHKQAAGRIEIMPGSGIRADNVGELLRETGCRAVHAACRGTIAERAGMGSRFEEVFGAPAAMEQTAVSQVRELRAAIDALGG